MAAKVQPLQLLGEEKKHSKFGASASERWLACPGSVALIEQAPPEKESPYAAEGTQAHSVLEAFLKLYITPMNLRDTQRAMQRLRDENPPEMVEHAYAAFQEIKRRYREADSEAKLLCETKVSLEFVAPGMFGTVDAAVVEQFGRLIVFDFKYGAGVTVDPDDNSQLIYYALGIAHKYDFCFTEVEIVILQPRAYSEKGPVRSWVTTIDKLMEWEEIFRLGVQAASQRDAVLVPGEHCRWCRAKVICPAISGQALTKAKLVSPKNEIQIYELSAADLQRLPDLLDAAEKLDFWINAVRAFAHDVLERGGPVAGWKLVDKRPSRRWIDQAKAAEEAELFFGKKAFSRTLLSPAQLESVIPGEDTSTWVRDNCEAVSSGATMVRDSDKREAINHVHHDFSVQDDEVPKTRDPKKKRSRFADPSLTRRRAEDEFDELPT